MGLLCIRDKKHHQYILNEKGTNTKTNYVTWDNEEAVLEGIAEKEWRTEKHTYVI